jgi:NAD(P)H-dependent FMN reductase
MGEDWELSLVRLPKLSILPCKGCYACLLPDKECNLEDDVTWLLQQINEADAVIFSAPNYALAPVGIVKMLADRALQAAAYYEQFRKKRTTVALTLGREEYRGYADTALAAQVAALGLDVAALEYFYGTHPGEAATAADFEGKVARLVSALIDPDFNGSVSPERCPLCFSDLFRIRPEGLECAVCKALATLEEGTLRFFSFHSEFSEEGRREHMNWLLMKKEEYPRIRGRLKQVQDKYRQGKWISPILPGKNLLDKT